MNEKHSLEDKIIENYQKDEHMMILVFAQWCVNHELNPEELYRRAYPDQQKNEALLQSLELTVPKEEAGEISNDTVLGVLSLFGNDNLAFIVSQEVTKMNK